MPLVADAPSCQCLSLMDSSNAAASARRRRGRSWQAYATGWHLLVETLPHSVVVNILVSIVTAASARDESPSVQHLGHCARAMIAEALELERLAAPRRRQREAGERASHAAGPASAAVAVRPGIVPAPRPKPRPRSRPVVPVQPAGTLRPPAHPESVRPASRSADHTVVPRPRGAVQPQPPARPAGTASAFAVGTVIGHSRPVRARGTVADLLWPQRMGRVTLTTRQ